MIPACLSANSTVNGDGSTKYTLELHFVSSAKLWRNARAMHRSTFYKMHLACICDIVFPALTKTRAKDTGAL